MGFDTKLRPAERPHLPGCSSVKALVLVELAAAPPISRMARAQSREHRLRAGAVPSPVAGDHMVSPRDCNCRRSEHVGELGLPTFCCSRRTCHTTAASKDYFTGLKSGEWYLKVLSLFAFRSSQVVLWDPHLFCLVTILSQTPGLILSSAEGTTSVFQENCYLSAVPLPANGNGVGAPLKRHLLLNFH